jgi:hypothetical protein
VLHGIRSTETLLEVPREDFSVLCPGLPVVEEQEALPSQGSTKLICLFVDKENPIDGVTGYVARDTKTGYRFSLYHPSVVAMRQLLGQEVKFDVCNARGLLNWHRRLPR